MFRVVLVVLIAGLAGCATTEGLGRALQYKQKHTTVAMADDTYRVFEHPSEKTLMTTTSFRKAVGVAAAQGVTFGLAQPFTPEQLHQAAARNYLDDTDRRDCTITSGYLLAQPQYEFTYECPPSTG